MREEGEGGSQVREVIKIGAVVGGRGEGRGKYVQRLQGSIGALSVSRAGQAFQPQLLHLRRGIHRLSSLSAAAHHC